MVGAVVWAECGDYDGRGVQSAGLALEKLLTDHPRAGTGKVLARKLGLRNVVGYQYDFFVYKNMTRRPHMTKRYEGS